MVQLSSSLVAQRLKRLPPVREPQVWSRGQEDPLEKEIVTHSSILAWRVPWMEKPGRLQSMGSPSRTQLSDFTYVLTSSHLYMTTGKTIDFHTLNESISYSDMWLFATTWTVAHQAPLSIAFPRQKYWSGLPFPSPGNLPSPGTEPRCPALQADSLWSEPPGKPPNKV